MEEIHLRNLAYLGDAVWELYIREKTILQTHNAKQLHELTTNMVKASFQCEMLKRLEADLTDEEKEISRRARNLPIPCARRQNQGEYRLATSFETLIGWWYMHDKEKLYKIYESLNI